MPEKHERPIAPFADIHVEDGEVIAVLLHDPAVEGLDAAIYLDASGSMAEEYKYDKHDKRAAAAAAVAEAAATAAPPPPKRGAIGRLFGWFKKATTPRPMTNDVEPEAQSILEYLATKDRNGKLRICYWSNGVEHVGELGALDARKTRFAGPKGMQMGGTELEPALRDYVDYLKVQVKTGARRGLAVIITDGRLQDEKKVVAFSAEVAEGIAEGRLPRMNFVLVGVGDDVDEEQMERICHEEYEGVGHLWCHRIAKEVSQMAEIVAVLVDETMTVAAGGTIYDDRMQVIKTYKGRLPAVLKFAVPAGSKNFTLEVEGRQYTQRIPDEEHEEEHETASH